MRAAVARHGSIDGLFNTCGVFEPGTIVDGDPELFTAMFVGNVLTTLNSCRAAVPNMTAGPSIINVAATAGLRAEAGMGAYAAAKSGVMRLSEALKVELKDQRIDVRCLMPATLDTPRNRQEMPEADWTRWEPVEEVAERMLVMGGCALRSALSNAS